MAVLKIRNWLCGDPWETSSALNSDKLDKIVKFNQHHKWPEN